MRLPLPSLPICLQPTHRQHPTRPAVRLMKNLDRTTPRPNHFLFFSDFSCEFQINGERPV